MEGLGECQQSGFSEKLPCKRRRISLQSSSDDNLSNVERGVMDLQILSMDVDGMCADEASADLPEKSSELGLTQPGYIAKASSTCLVGPEASNEQGDLDISQSHVHLEECKVPDYVEGTESSDAVLIDILTAGASSDTVSEAKSSATTVCKRDIPSTDSFVLRSVLKKPSGNLFAENLQDPLANPGVQPTPLTKFKGARDPRNTFSCPKPFPSCCKPHKSPVRSNFRVVSPQTLLLSPLWV
ncbi:Hypothetical predicted protein [Marmota monax]|uniref:Uncharacterized protein n=1 Tax=Marmota monax TaxID=9995 RepID=A0A5E4BA24_MARMO|nr:hypothetical protein GHT09_006505 [Marmota monax]VTJ66175.1 Hypothetical predicted protein [Marmota monax]